MPERSQPTPLRRVPWPLVCALLAVVLAVSSVLVAPSVLAELTPPDGPEAGGGTVAGTASATHTAPGDGAASSGEAASDDGAASGQDAASGDGVAASRTPGQDAPPVDAQTVQRTLDAALEDAPGRAGAAVLSEGSGELVAHQAETTPVVPASNQKILTALSLAEHLDPQRRLATTVVTGEDPSRLTLVAGGDTLLAPGDGDPDAVNGHAGLGTLAQRTAEALRERSPEAVRGSVTVALDTTLFTGPDLNPAWDGEDVASGEITRVAPLALFSHRVPTAEGTDPGSRGKRPEDPAEAAARAFTDRLSEALGGTRVDLAGSARAPESAAELARVESAPVHEQSAYMLAHSDNSLAETLARVAAVASGREGGVTGVQEMLPETLRAHGIETDGLTVLDASGMAARDRVTPLTLARTVQTLVTEDRFAPYGRGLPVGGGEGTLASRFADPSEAAARGVTRAKTGTLLDVASLSGYVQREDGSVLVYSLVLNGVEGKTARARDTVDTAVAELARSS